MPKLKKIFSYESSWLASWTGRLMLVNTLVFLALSICGMSLFTTDPEILSRFGANDPVLVGQGQAWRLFTAMFVHVGLLHFILNSMALRVVGRVMEETLGGRYFLAIYLGAGIAGNILSTYSHLILGAGASGAIFGLIGAGLCFEWLFRGRQLYFLRPRPKLQAALNYLLFGPFATATWLNFALAIGLNEALTATDWFHISIDNSAHLGGLAFGFLATFALLNLIENSLWVRRPFIGWIMALSLAFGTFMAGYKLIGSPYIAERFLEKADETDDLIESYYYLTMGLKICPSNPDLLFARARIAALAGEILMATRDLGRIKDLSQSSFLIYRLIKELKAHNMIDEASQLEEFISTIMPSENENT